MDTRNRTLLLTVTGLIAAGAIATSCAADVESVSSTGTAGVSAGVERSAPSQMPGSTSTSMLANGSPATGSATTDSPPAPESSSAPGPTFNTTIPDPDTPVTAPPVTATPTIPASGQDPAFIDCGVVYRASGWPTTFAPNPTTFACLADAFAAGTPARLVDREQTDGYGGAILITTYDVLGPGTLRMTVDATAAAHRPQVVTVSQCTGVVAEMMDLVVSGCTVVG